ncbi:hypothetical protein GCM10027032_02680 [Simplicispira piscis]
MLMASWRFAFIALCCVTPSKSLSVPVVSPVRLGVVDALRGSAMVWMSVFHFCFDLSHFGYWPQDFRSDPVWTLQRTLIVSLFLLCAGMGQAVAIHQGQSWNRFGKRWMQIATCAMLVTLGSLAMFPRSYIYFGVLHGMAVMLPLVRATASWRRWLWLAGGIALALPWMAHAALTGPLADWAVYFNARPLNWLGLVSRKPFTEDYVPLLPWLGVMWWGMAAGIWLLEHRTHWLQVRLPAGLQGLAVLGRWSLSYYMLHQPVLLGLLLLWGVVAGH